MKLIAKTPVGTFTSIKDCSSGEEEKLIKLIKESDGYMSFQTEDGLVIIKDEALKNTVFIVQD